MRRVPATAVLLAVASLVVGCAGVPIPPPPHETLRPDRQGGVVAEQQIGCYSNRYSLDSGGSVDLRVTDGHCVNDEPDTTLTPVIPRTTYYTPKEPFVGDYIYLGHYPSGAMWYFVATSAPAADASDQCRYELGAGGYDEGPNFHLSSGLIVPKAADVTYVMLPPEELTQQEQQQYLPTAFLCANSKGEIARVEYPQQPGW